MKDLLPHIPYVLLCIGIFFIALYSILRAIDMLFDWNSMPVLKEKIKELKWENAKLRSENQKLSQDVENLKRLI